MRPDTSDTLCFLFFAPGQNREAVTESIGRDARVRENLDACCSVTGLTFHRSHEFEFGEKPRRRGEKSLLLLFSDVLSGCPQCHSSVNLFASTFRCCRMTIYPRNSIKLRIASCMFHVGGQLVLGEPVGAQCPAHGAGTIWMHKER